MTFENRKKKKSSKVLIGEILEAEKSDNADGKFDEQKDRQTVLDGFWKKVRKTSRKIPFMEDVVAAYYCALDNNTPTRVRAILFAALAYFILPLDSIPDFLLGFGFTDDIAVLMAAFSAVKSNITEQHYSLAHEKLAEDDDQETE